MLISCKHWHDLQLQMQQ